MERLRASDPREAQAPGEEPTRPRCYIPSQSCRRSSAYHRRSTCGAGWRREGASAILEETSEGEESGDTHLCWTGGIPSFSSTRSLMRSIVSLGSMSISISLPVRVFTLIIWMRRGEGGMSTGCPLMPQGAFRGVRARGGPARREPRRRPRESEEVFNTHHLGRSGLVGSLGSVEARSDLCRDPRVSAHCSNRTVLARSHQVCRRRERGRVTKRND